MKQHYIFCIAALAALICPLCASAGTFTGPGLFTDKTKWSNGALPANSRNEDVYIKGLCGATNVSERLEGGRWFHLGCNASGWLEVKDCDFYFKDFRLGKAGYTGIYRQNGGSLWLSSDSTALGYGAGYIEAGMILENVAVTNKAIKIGSTAPKNNRRGGGTYPRQSRRSSRPG